MASVDGSRSLQGVSDEQYDADCGPCQTDKIEKQAKHYCKECREYLCNPCKDYHRKLAVAKNHTILSENKISTPTSVNQQSGFVMFCGCNKNQEIVFYCEDHRDVICDPCKTVKHRSCEITDVKSKSANYTTATLDPVSTKAKSLILSLVTMQMQRKSDSKAGKSPTEECKKEIKQFRATIDAFLDNLEHNSLQELVDFDNEQKQDIDQQIATLTTGLQMLISDHKLLEDARITGNKITMFTTEVHVSKSLRDYEAMLDEIETNASKSTLHFAGNQRLIDLQTEISSLGHLIGKDTSLCTGDKVELTRNRKVLLGKKAKSIGQMNVKDSDDDALPCISGCTFMANGHAVLCDRSNAKIKLLDRALVFRESLRVDSLPWDVLVIDDNNVIITMPNTKHLQYIQVFPQLKTGRTIQLDKECRGITLFGDEIYTTQSDGSARGEIRVLDLNGNMMRKLQNSFTFGHPYYITVSASGKKIFVSDGERSRARITCMAADGSMVYQYSHEESVMSLGMYVDAEDNILVCDYASNSVQVITANGKQYGTLLSSSDGISDPYSIAYRETDDTLLVGCSAKDHVLIYKLV